MRIGVALVLLVTVSACVPMPPRPPQPPVPRLRAVAIVVPDGVATGTAYVDDAGGGHTCQLVAGYCEVQQTDAPAGQTYVLVNADGYDTYRQDAVTLPAGNVQIWLGAGCGMPTPSQCVNLPPLVPSFQPLPRLVVNGGVFSFQDGKRWTWIGASSFDLYRQFLVDEGSITPVVAQLRSLGFNVVRVFGSFAGVLGRFVPFDGGDRYYTQLPKFADALARQGMYLELTVFADTTQWQTDRVGQIAHWDRVRSAVADRSNVFLEAVNEADQPINLTAALDLFTMPNTVNSSHGSNGSQAQPVTPFWHYLTFHTNGASEWWRKAGHNCQEIDPRPCVADENTRPDQDGNFVHFYDAAAGAALLAAGSTFHSQSGKASVLLTGADLTAARQWVLGALSVPLACQAGAYKHRQDLEVPGILRAYQRGDDVACIVRIRQ